MSYQIIEPLNQVRLTNVAVVRLSRHGHRFEVACYRNKIVNYRQGTETDLGEVLQTERVFTNVSKGQFANSKTLLKCFDTADEVEVCRFILDRGDVQVSDQERAARLESTIREVASMVSEKCVDPASRRPYTMAQIRDAMKRSGFMVHPTRNTKQQFLDCVRLLQRKGVLNIERAKMQLALVLSSSEEDKDDGDDSNDNDDDLGTDNGKRRNAALNLLLEEGVIRSDISPPKHSDDPRIVFQSDPSLYRKMESIARDPSVRARVEIVQQCVTEEGDATLGSELERRAQQQQEQRQRNDTDATTDGGAPKNNTRAAAAAVVVDEDDGVGELSRKLQSDLALNDDNAPVSSTSASNDDDRNDPAGRAPPANSRKAQKAAQKKSKKAKRREKEERAEREARVAAEKMRQRERADRLGLTREEDGAGARCDVISPGAGGARTNGAGADDGGRGGGGGATKPCNTCGGAFAPGEYRLHFRSDWHRYNVKLKMRGAAPVCEREFLLCDSDAFFD